MRKTVALPFAALALASVIAAGCSGSGYGSATPAATGTPFVVPSAACTMPPGVTNLKQVFPQNGASAAPNLQGVVIAVAPIPLPTDWFFYSSYVQPSPAATILSYPVSLGHFATPSPSPGPTSTATPLPTPSDTPGFAGAIFEVASNGIFANASTFTIFAASSTCFPGIQLNTFTTSTTDQPTPSATAT